MFYILLKRHGFNNNQKLRKNRICTALLVMKLFPPSNSGIKEQTRNGGFCKQPQNDLKSKMCYEKMYVYISQLYTLY